MSNKQFPAQGAPVFGPSGTGHSEGLVPDPGASVGTTKFLCEDGTFKTPSGGGVSDFSTRKRVFEVTGALLASTTFANLTAAGYGLGAEIVLQGGIQNSNNPTTSPRRGAGIEINDGGNGSDWLGGLRVWTPTYFNYCVGLNCQLWSSLYLTGTTNMRFWCGFTTTCSGSTPTQYGGNDLPSAFGSGFIGFRYSTVAGDTNFQCVMGDGTNETIVDSGIAADTHGHTFVVIMDDNTPQVKFYIDSVLVATITTHLLTPGTTMGYVCGSAFHVTSGSRFCFGALAVQTDL